MVKLKGTFLPNATWKQMSTLWWKRVGSIISCLLTDILSISPTSYMVSCFLVSICQKYRHTKYTLDVQKSCVQKKVFVKCWWNWNLIVCCFAKVSSIQKIKFQNKNPQKIKKTVFVLCDENLKEIVDYNSRSLTSSRRKRSKKRSNMKIHLKELLFLFQEYQKPLLT